MKQRARTVWLKKGEQEEEKKWVPNLIACIKINSTSIKDKIQITKLKYCSFYYLWWQNLSKFQPQIISYLLKRKPCEQIGVGRKAQEGEIYLWLWLICTVVQKKATQHCETHFPPIKKQIKNLQKTGKKIFNFYITEAIIKVKTQSSN